MTSRADLPRLAGSLGVLGTVLEQHGQTAFDRMDGWQHGPRKAPERGERGGGGGEAGQEDRKDEAIQRALAAKRFQQYRLRLGQLDTLVQDILRDVDIACPPNPEEMKNRHTGEYEPWTPAEVELAGWCSSCWRHEQTFTAIYTDPKGMRRWKGSCSWCGPIRSQHKIDPPMDLLVKHLANKNIAPEEYEAAITKAKQIAQPKKKGRKGKKAKAA